VAFAGEVASQVLEGQQSYDLVVRFDSTSRGTLERITQARFDTPVGTQGAALGAGGAGSRFVRRIPRPRPPRGPRACRREPGAGALALPPFGATHVARRGRHARGRAAAGLPRPRVRRLAAAVGTEWRRPGAGWHLPLWGCWPTIRNRRSAGRAYAAHFALTHLFWLFTYPAAGYLARGIGTPATFTAAGVFCLMLVLAAFTIRGPHRQHTLMSDT
jgi:hypothetical protein